MMRTKYFCRSVDSWQINFEGSALHRLTVGPYVSITLFHDSVYRGKTQSSALPGFLGREKWLKNMRDRLCIHSATSVTDGKHHIRPRIHREVLRPVSVIQFDIGSLNDNLSPF